MIVLDASVIIDSLTGSKRSAPALRSVIAQGERLLLPSVVLSEWLRGPRLVQELAAQEALFPSDSTVPFGPLEASISAQLYRSLPKPRGREIDIAIAACALGKDCPLWTLNTADFKDVPRLRLWPIAR